MSGLPLANPIQKSINQNEATSATTNRKDPYADMGTMVLSADKREKDQKSLSSVSTRSFLLQEKNGTVVSLEDKKGMKGSNKNPYSEMGVTIDFPEKKSKSRDRQTKIDLLARLSSSPERRMIKKIGDPYSDLGSSTALSEPKDQTSRRKSESDAPPLKKDISEIAANLNKLIEKAQEISSKASLQPSNLHAQVSKITKGNATAPNKDPYADVGSITKKSTKSVSLAGTKKDLNALLESPTDEEFANDSEGKSRTAKDSTPKQISGNSVTGLTGTSNMKLTKGSGTLQGYKKKDPYSDVGSAVDIKE